MPKLVLTTNASNSLGQEDANCACAVLDMIPELAELVRRRSEVALCVYQEHLLLYELSFWIDREAEFYDRSVLEAACKRSEAFQIDLQNRGCAFLPQGLSVEQFRPQHTECNQMVLRISRFSPNPPRVEVAWSAIVRNGDLTVTTVAMPVAELQQLSLQAADGAELIPDLP